MAVRKLLNITKRKKARDSVMESQAFAVVKEGGFLLSRIALQYHRRKRA